MKITSLIIVSLLLNCKISLAKHNIITTSPIVDLIVKEIAAHKNIKISNVNQSDCGCHHLNLKPSTIKKLMNAELIITNNELVNTALNKFLEKTDHILILDKISDLPVAIDNSDDDNIWLNSKNALKLASELKLFLINNLPQYTQIFETNFHKFVENLNNINIDNKNLLNGEISFFITNNNLDYFAQEHQIKNYYKFKHTHYYTAKQMLALEDIINSNKIACLLIEDNTQDNKLISILNIPENVRVKKLDFNNENYFDLLNNITSTIKDCKL